MNKKLSRYKRIIEKFNADLNDYYTRTGESELLEVDSSIIGQSERVDPFTLNEDGDSLIVDMGWQTKTLTVIEEDGETYILDWDSGMDNVKDCIEYYRRMLRKSWRVYRSDNPDAEIEKEDEDD